jgi:hypothetical protein
MKTSSEQLTTAARTVSLEASANAGRIHPALLAIDDAEGHLRATAGGNSGGDMPDPTFNAVGKIDEAAKDRRRIETILTQQLGLSKELAGILANWAPNEDTQTRLRGVSLTNDDVWCANHHAHGMMETKAVGRTHCDWCTDFKQRYKILPTRWLCDVASRRRINSADIAKAIRDHAAELREKRAEAKLRNAAG